MQIGQVIRHYRKEKDMTQEEMENRLGVTAPAVNKWEKGSSMPDITLLAPIARLLGISLDTLLSFREELTWEEIQDIIYTLNSMLRKQFFEEAFAYAKEKIAQYPNCESLILEAAVLLNAARMRVENETENNETVILVPPDSKQSGKKAESCDKKEVYGEEQEHGMDEQHGESKAPGVNRKERTGGQCDTNESAGKDSTEEDYDTVINGWLTGALKSEQEQIRTMAAVALFAFYLSGEQYEKAEACLVYYSEQNPERKCKQARIYSKTGRTKEAYQTYEGLLLDLYQKIDLLFHSIGALAAQDQNMDKVRAMARKHSALAEIFEMGEYHRICGGLELAVMEKDVEATITIMQQLLACTDDLYHFTEAPLYEHMTFRELRPEFAAQIREDLLKSFQDEATYGFLQGDSRWKEIVGI